MSDAHLGWIDSSGPARRRRRRRRLGLGAGVICGFAALLLVALVLRHPAGVPPPPSDVIVVLAGSPERAPYAEALVERGTAPRLLSTLVDPQCVRAGRPPSACRSGVRNTVDEALLMRRALEAEGVKEVTVVTSGYHRLRAAAVFEIVFLWSGIRVRVVAPPGPPADREEVAHEVWSFLPSVGAAVIGRLSPSLYEWIV